MIRRRPEVWIILGILISLGVIIIPTLVSGTSKGDSRNLLEDAASVSSELIFSTYLEGTSYDTITEMVIDSQGDIYLTGHTESTDFPTTEGAFDRSHNGGTEDWFPIDAFVMKLSGDGQEIFYSTFLGGSGDDYAISIAVDNEGSAYVAG